MYEFRQLFTTICNMSITLVFVILFVILIRQFLKKSYKSFSYYLWGLVGFRLVCPVSFSSAFSLFNLPLLKSLTVSGNTMEWKGAPDYKNSEMYVWEGRNITGAETVVKNEIVGGVETEVIYEPDPLLTVDKLEVFAFIWIFVVGILLAYQFYTYMKLKKQLEMAVLVKENIYECDRIAEPFVLGFFRPKIYIPFRLSETEKAYILQHEKYHIKRHDHQIKLIAILLLAIHWFNPFVWVAYYLMCKDMEMSCDEQVLIKLGSEIKKEYSNSLLGFAMGRRTWSLGTLAFGETSVAERVKNILKFKKPGKSVVIISTALCLVVILFGIANGEKKNAIRNITDETGVSAEYEYQFSDEIKSFVIYKEYYRYGELEEYEIILTGTFGENEYPLEGTFDVTYGIEQDENNLWRVTFGYEMDGIGTITFNEAEKYGYTGVAPTFYLENSGAWEEIEAEEEIILAVYNMDDGNGVIAYNGDYFQDEETKYYFLSDNAGEILFRIVFSKKDVQELENDYRISTNIIDLFEAKNPYIGDHITDGKILKILNASSADSFELQTSEEPYGVILHYDTYQPENEEAFRKERLKDATFFLTVTENADFFEWRNLGEDGMTIEKNQYYVKDIEQILGIENLKSFAESEEKLQELAVLIENSEW